MPCVFVLSLCLGGTRFIGVRGKAYGVHIVGLSLSLGCVKLLFLLIVVSPPHMGTPNISNSAPTHTAPPTLHTINHSSPPIDSPHVAPSPPSTTSLHLCLHRLAVQVFEQRAGFFFTESFPGGVQRRERGLPLFFSLCALSEPKLFFCKWTSRRAALSLSCHDDTRLLRCTSTYRIGSFSRCQPMFAKWYL
jgi:hypothetical protein